MANYHILKGSSDGNSLVIVFHIPIPDQDNDVSVNLRTALSEMLGGSMTSQVPSNRLGVGEQVALDAGELYEYTLNYHTHPGMTLLDKRADLDSKFTSLSTSITNQVAAQLAFWGYERDVA